MGERWELALYPFNYNKKPKTQQNQGFRHCINVPERIRTAGLPLRRRTLYPAELQKPMHKSAFFNGLCNSICCTVRLLLYSQFPFSSRQILYFFQRLLKIHGSLHPDLPLKPASHFRSSHQVLFCNSHMEN